MADVVPDISLRRIVSKRQCSLEAAQGHIVLRGIEAAQAYIVPQLSRVDSTLQQSFVETQSHLWLVGIEMITGNRGN